MLGRDTSRPVPRSDGTTDLYIVRDRFQELFCADVPASQAARMAATQRPATQEALSEPSGERPLWRELPSWFLIGEDDRIIPPELQRFMAERARAQRTLGIPGASHALPVSEPKATTELILEAAACPRRPDARPTREIQHVRAGTRSVRTQKARYAGLLQSPLTDSNRRPPPYHGGALPAELRGREGLG